MANEYIRKREGQTPNAIRKKDSGVKIYLGKGVLGFGGGNKAIKCFLMKLAHQIKDGRPWLQWVSANWCALLLNVATKF